MRRERIFPFSETKRRSEPTSFQSTRSILSLQYGQDLRRPLPGPPRLSRRGLAGFLRCFATDYLVEVRCLEGDVVLGRRARRGGEVPGVHRDVTAGVALKAAVARPGGGVVAATEELDGIGNDIDRLPLVPLLVLPLAPLEAAVERD